MTEYLDTLLALWPAWALVATIVVSILALGKGADVLVEDAVAISLQWGIPSVVVGATVVSLGTTTPEAVVSVLAAMKGESGLALGNAVGSIICDTGLILGIACVISPLPFDKVVADRQGWVQFLSGVLLVAACLPWASLGSAFAEGGLLPQAAGWIFLALLGLYLRWSVQLASRVKQSDASGVGEAHQFRGRRRRVPVWPSRSPSSSSLRRFWSHPRPRSRSGLKSRPASSPRRSWPSAPRCPSS